MKIFERRRAPRVHSVGAPRDDVMTASAARLRQKDRREAREVRELKQGWQADAWAYRDSIGELRYATEFKAHAAARMRLFPAVYPTDGETDEPIALSKAEGITEQLISASEQILSELGKGRLAVAHLLNKLSENWSVAGEAFLLGLENAETGLDEWTIRSNDEVIIYNEKYFLREVPNDPMGIMPWVEIPDPSVIVRMWKPHPRFAKLADSPYRAILEECESLLIHRRTIRSIGRSRIAGRGLLLIPEELQIKAPVEDNEDPEADPFFSQLAQVLMAPIADEGVASAVTPAVVRGPAAAMQHVQHIDFATKFDEASAKIREELVGVIATGLDLPKEIVMGVADLNHWSAWQVEDNTFRHHLEPHVIELVEAITLAYYRPALENMGFPTELVKRCVVWYDPTELVTHPDQAKDAKDLYDRHAISAKALARTTGFSDEDMPSPEETVIRMLQNMRTPPANLVMAAVHQMFPSLTIPPITVPSTVPGVKPGGVDPGEPAQPPPAAPGEAPPPPATEIEGTAEEEEDEQKALPALPEHAPSLTAATTPPPLAEMSAKLMQMDRDVRTFLQASACAAVMRQLERAGAKVRTKVARDETMRKKIAMRKNERVTAYLGEAIVGAILSPDELVEPEWEQLRSLFFEQVTTVQKSALQALRDEGAREPVLEAALEKLQAARQPAWEWLAAKLTELTKHHLYSPDPNSSSTEWGDVNPNSIVPAGLIRSALAIAGGTEVSRVASAAPTPPNYRDAEGAENCGACHMFDQGKCWGYGNVAVEPDKLCDSFAPDAETAAAGIEGGAVLQPVGQIGTGEILGEALGEEGIQPIGYRWVHGAALRPFEPHEALEGLEFQSFTDDALRNTGSWPEGDFFMPGDHPGCMCDFEMLHACAPDAGPEEGDEPEGAVLAAGVDEGGICGVGGQSPWFGKTVEQSEGPWSLSNLGVDISAEEKDALDYYVDGGAYTINPQLRGETVGPFIENKTPAEVQQYAAHLDSLIDKAKPTKKPTVVMRKIAGPGTPWDKLKPGDVWTDEGYSSATVNKELVKEWGGSGPVVTIRVPEGTKGIYVNKWNKQWYHGEKVGYQREIILPRGSKFKIVKRKGNEITVELLHDPHTDVEKLAAEPDVQHVGDKKALDLGIKKHGAVPNYAGTPLHDFKAAGGSTGAKFATGPDGKQWLLKTYNGSQDRVATELLSNAIYRELGINTPKAGSIVVDGKKALAYPTVEGKVETGSWWSGRQEEMGKGYMADALLGNRDFIGLSKDNVLWDNGKPIRIDQGGTLEFRAQGSKKEFGPVPTEVTSLIHYQGAGNVSLSEADQALQAQAIAGKLTPERIHELVADAEFQDKEMAARVEKNLNARVQYMKEHYKPETPLPKPEPKPEPTVKPPPPKPEGLIWSDGAYWKQIGDHIKSGDLAPSDLQILAGAKGDSAEAAAAIAEKLKQHGVRVDEGFYDRGFGKSDPLGDAHVWNRLPNGDILDVTHSQFGDAQVVILKPTDAEYHKYIPYEFMTPKEAAAQFLDPPTELQRKVFKYHPPKFRMNTSEKISWSLKKTAAIKNKVINIAYKEGFGPEQKDLLTKALKAGKSEEEAIAKAKAWQPLYSFQKDFLDKLTGEEQADWALLSPGEKFTVEQVAAGDGKMALSTLQDYAVKYKNPAPAYSEANIAQKKIVKEFVFTPTGAEPEINTYLRGVYKVGSPYADNSKHLSVSLKQKKKAEQLDELISQQGEIKAGTKLYRSFKLSNFAMHNGLTGLKEGDTFTDAGYMSTWLEHKAAGEAEFVINVGEGFQGLDVSKVLGVDSGEILLPRGTSIKITKVDKSVPGQVKYEGELVHNEIFTGGKAAGAFKLEGTPGKATVDHWDKFGLKTGNPSPQQIKEFNELVSAGMDPVKANDTIKTYKGGAGFPYSEAGAKYLRIEKLGKEDQKTYMQWDDASKAKYQTSLDKGTLQIPAFQKTSANAVSAPIPGEALTSDTIAKEVSSGKFREQSTRVWKQTAGGKAIPQETWSSVRSYQDGGYHQMNSNLRRGRALGAPERRIQELINSTPGTTEDTVLWRGVGSGVDYSGLKPGQVFTEPGFASTSTGSGFGGRQKLKILAPKGTKGFDMNAWKNNSGYAGEKEILLPAGSRFEVLQSVRYQGTLYVEVRLLPPGVG